MPLDPSKVRIFHITPIANLAAIVAGGGLLSDAGLASFPHQVIGYGHIKERRLTRYRVSCCGNKAACALANKLARICYATLRDGEPFGVERLTKKMQRTAFALPA